MATLNTTNIKHASSGSNNIVLNADGSTTISNLSNAGKILQFKSTTKTDTASFQVAAGADYHYTDTSLRVTITPTSASNFLYIMGHVSVGRELLNWMQVAIDKDGSAFTQAIGDAASNRGRRTVGGSNPNTNLVNSFPFHAKVTAENTTERYYSLNFSHGSSSSRWIYLNRGSGDTNAVQYGRYISTITVMEIAA